MHTCIHTYIHTRRVAYNVFDDKAGWRGNVYYNKYTHTHTSCFLLLCFLSGLFLPYVFSPRPSPGATSACSTLMPSTRTWRSGVSTSSTSSNRPWGRVEGVLLTMAAIAGATAGEFEGTEAYRGGTMRPGRRETSGSRAATREFTHTHTHTQNILILLIV